MKKSGRYKRGSLDGLTEKQIQMIHKEQARAWSATLPDDAFGDDVIDEPTYGRVNLRETEIIGGGSSLD